MFESLQMISELCNYKDLANYVINSNQISLNKARKSFLAVLIFKLLLF